MDKILNNYISKINRQKGGQEDLYVYIGKNKNCSNTILEKKQQVLRSLIDIDNNLLHKFINKYILTKNYCFLDKTVDKNKVEITLKGILDNTSELPKTSSDGDAYIILINKILHISCNNEWFEIGKINNIDIIPKDKIVDIKFMLIIDEKLSLKENLLILQNIHGIIKVNNNKINYNLTDYLSDYLINKMNKQIGGNDIYIDYSDDINDELNIDIRSSPRNDCSNNIENEIKKIEENLNYRGITSEVIEQIKTINFNEIFNILDELQINNQKLDDSILMKIINIINILEIILNNKKNILSKIDNKIIDNKNIECKNCTYLLKNLLILQNIPYETSLKIDKIREYSYKLFEYKNKDIEIDTSRDFVNKLEETLIFNETLCPPIIYEDNKFDEDNKANKATKDNKSTIPLPQNIISIPITVNETPIGNVAPPDPINGIPIKVNEPLKYGVQPHATINGIPITVNNTLKYGVQSPASINGIPIKVNEPQKYDIQPPSNINSIPIKVNEPPKYDIQPPGTINSILIKINETTKDTIPPPATINPINTNENIKRRVLPGEEEILGGNKNPIIILKGYINNIINLPKIPIDGDGYIINKENSLFVASNKEWIEIGRIQNFNQNLFNMQIKLDSKKTLRESLFELQKNKGILNIKF